MGKMFSMVALTIVRLLEFISLPVPKLCATVNHSSQESITIEVLVYLSSASTNGRKSVGAAISSA